jgi:hypothetical protein
VVFELVSRESLAPGELQMLVEPEGQEELNLLMTLIPASVQMQAQEESAQGRRRAMPCLRVFFRRDIVVSPRPPR